MKPDKRPLRFRVRMLLSVVLLVPTTCIVVWALNQMPQSRSDWQVERGFWLQRQGDRAGALAAFSEAIRINPDNAGARNERARIYRLTGKYQAALDDLTYVLSLYPDQADVYVARGTVYAEMGDQSAAIRDFTRALELRPQFAAVYEARAHAYDALGDLDAACADYAAFLRLYDAPDDRRSAAAARLEAFVTDSQ